MRMLMVVLKSRLSLLLLCLFTLASCGGGPKFNSGAGADTGNNTSSSSAATFDTALLASGKQLYEQKCARCHDDPAKEGLDAHLVTIKNSRFATIELLSSRIENTMPQGAIGTCTGDCAKATAAFIRNNFSTENTGLPPSDGNSGTAPDSDSATAPAPKGQMKASPVTIHRLNRSEYNNTVRDLFSTTLKPADTFPEDDFGYGFNNIAELLSLSLAHVEQYEKAANALIDQALGSTIGSSIKTFNAEEFGSEAGAAQQGYWAQWSAGTVTIPVSTNAAGKYTLRIVAGQQAGGTENANMKVIVNGVFLKDVSVSAPQTSMQTYVLETNLKAGSNTVAMEFTNDYYLEGVADRNLAIDVLEVEGPTGVQATTALAELSCGATPATNACARKIAEKFGARAWRRPLTVEEVNELVGIYDFATSQAATHNQSVKQLLKALLLSSNFIYRSEIDPDLNTATPRNLNAYELASRLSYFLWSSMPDATLLDLAASGDIQDPIVLRAQVKRMLDDSKSSMLVENFAVQWLKFDKVAEKTPDLSKFPNFNNDLMQAMRQETRLFLTDMIKNNEPVSRLFTANYTYLNQALAAHYGVNGIQGNNFQRFNWAGSDARRGILGQASVLTATSHPGTTSPVLRGKWVLENLLCDEPPPPPAGVENLTEVDLTKLSTRKRFEAHSEKGSSCFGCHQTMDPIGFGLENFNPVGQWRAVDGTEAVDSSGKLPSGATFSGAVELGNILAQSYRLPMCTTEHLMTFALGRGVEALGYGDEKADYPIVYDIYQKTAANGYKIRDIIEEIVLSNAFRMRAGANSTLESL
jgi:mono/diheme cytochrome c family protein